MSTTVQAPVGSRRSRGRLFTWPLLIGVVLVGGLVVLSLFVGVYDVFGQPDGAEMFAITRIPRTVCRILA